MKNEKTTNAATITTADELRAHLEAHPPREHWNAAPVTVNGYVLRVYSSRDYSITDAHGVGVSVDYYADYISNGESRRGIDEIIARIFGSAPAEDVSTKATETPAPEATETPAEIINTESPASLSPSPAPVSDAAALPVGALTFPRLYRLIIKHYAAEDKKYIFFIKRGYFPDWATEHRNDPDRAIKKYLTPARLAKYERGEMPRAEAIKHATARALREVDSYRQKQIKKLNAAALVKTAPHISIIISYTRSRVWGYNPCAEVQTTYNAPTFGTASGCGYDKTSAATADALNKSPAILRALYEAAERATKRGANLPEAGARWGSVLGYGAGYSVLPYFEGGCGQSCIINILENSGYIKTSESHGDAATVYTFERAKK